jgi:2-amino-4-hydroxy-6-hydroxymethyldihydropteridine diphosphokinase
LSEHPSRHNVILLIGSNIHPRENIDRVLAIIRGKFHLSRISTIIETEPYRSSGENFLNLAVEITTTLSTEELKSILRQIECDLGRIRTEDKYAPRTIDLDITVYDGRPTDEELWSRVFVAIPVAELLPDLIQVESGQSIRNIADQLKSKSWMRVHPAPSLE